MLAKADFIDITYNALLCIDCGELKNTVVTQRTHDLWIEKCQAATEFLWSKSAWDGRKT